MSEDTEPAGDGSARQEPAHNLARGTAAGIQIDDPQTRAARVVDRLGDLYWRTTYGGQNAFRCLVRTILSQNTTDAASQPAFDALVDRYDDADLVAALADADTDRLAEAIASAGLHNQKAERIQRIAAIVRDDHGDEDAFDRSVREGETGAVRERLLEFTGVGPKTADCVLLFAGGEDAIFPVDTHVHRIARRLGIAPPDADPSTVRARLEADVPDAACGFGHTAMIQFGREYCTARQPVCLDDPAACPLADCCDRVGVEGDAA